MTDYTPTTEEVWRAYINWEYGGPGAEFDRWLAEVKAEVWQEGFDRGVLFFNAGDERNPYRQENHATDSD